jgi:hypothetical protein
LGSSVGRIRRAALDHPPKRFFRPFPRATAARETLAPWVVAFIASGVLILLIELNKTRPDHHTIGVKIGAGVLIWLGLAAVVRFIIFVADQARTR